MKAIQVPRHGGPEVLTLVDLPVPQPKPNEIVVKIGAVGINFIDIYYREGRYPIPPPFVDGSEAAGTKDRQSVDNTARGDGNAEGRQR